MGIVVHVVSLSPRARHKTDASRARAIRYVPGHLLRTCHGLAPRGSGENSRTHSVPGLNDGRDGRRRIAGRAGRARQSLHPGVRRWYDDVHPQSVSHITTSSKTRLALASAEGVSEWELSAASGQEMPGNHRAISRSADSTESEPCTKLYCVSRPKSPRIVPGTAFSTGSVPPAS